MDIIKRVSSEKASKKQLQRYERALAQFLFKLNGDIADLYDLGVKFILGENGLPICKTLGATLLLKAYNALGKEAAEFPQLLMSLCYCNIKGIGISKNMKNAAYIYVLAGRPSSLTAFNLNSEDNGIAYKKPTGRKWNYYVVTQWILLKIKKPVGRAKDAAVDTSTSYAKKVMAYILGLIFLGPTMLLMAWLMESESELQQSTIGSFEQDEIMRGNAIGSALITIFFQLAWTYGVIFGIITLIAHFGFDTEWSTAFFGGGILAVPIGLFVLVKCLNYVSDVFPLR